MREDEGKRTVDVSQLRYGHILIMADQVPPLPY